MAKGLFLPSPSTNVFVNVRGGKVESGQLGQLGQLGRKGLR